MRHSNAILALASAAVAGLFMVAGGPAAAAGVTIATDDPSVTINEVYFERQPVAIAGRRGNEVQVLVDDQGLTCQRDLGLVLSDGRRIARMVDICANNGYVIVALNGDAGPAPGPTPTPAPGPAPEPAPVPPLVSNMTWSYSLSGDRAGLAYGVPETGTNEFFANCKTGSNQIELRLGRTSPSLQAGQAIPIGFAAGAFSQTYDGVGAEPRPPTGQSLPALRLPADDPLWSALISESELSIRIGSMGAYALSLRGSSTQVRQFLAACQTAGIAPVPPPPPPPPPPPGPGPAPAPVAGPSCRDEGRVQSVRSDDAATIVFHNLGSQPIAVYWLDFLGQRKPILTVGPGATVPQDTFVGHFWLAADQSGRCLGLYPAPQGRGDVFVGR